MDNALQRILSDHEEYLTFANGLRHETNRGAVLVSTCALDSLLEALLLSHFDLSEMNKDEKGALKRSIKNFTNKVAIAQGLGLIGTIEARALLDLNDVRNKFAHFWDASFLDEKVQKACQKLPIEFLDSNEKPLAEECFDRFKYLIDQMLRDMIARVSHLRAEGQILAHSGGTKLHREYVKTPW
ncbi:hypothetical protein KUV28_15890 [Ferrimonas balearica]|nr:hypothetical protein [Ferrimonas balearica]